MRSRPRRLALAGAAVVIAAIVVAGLALAGGGGDARSEGAPRPAPTFSLPDTVDPSSRVDLADYRRRPVVVNFWASWCVPCRKEMPNFQAAHERFGDRVTFLGVDHQDGRTPARDLLRQTGVTYRSGSDPDGKVASAYGLRGMPSTVFVSAEGQIVATRTGELSRSELEDMVEDLLSGTP